MKTLAAKIRERRIKPMVRQAGLVYDTDGVDIPGHQLTKFDTLWTEIQQHVPFYQNLVQSGKFPKAINTWDDFAHFPIVTREAIQENVTQYINQLQKIAGWSLTGGSTGTPFRTPYGPTEKQILMLSAWLGRGFYGIEISDRLFNFWGHSHLFGNGWQRHVKQLNRRVKDWLLGYKTLSAYHLTPQRLHLAGQDIIDMRPDYIIGHSRSLTLLARENSHRTTAFKELRLKAIFATSEAFSDPADAQLIEQVFGCPVGMEYGAAETGNIAFMHPLDQRYQVFWDLFLLEAVPINETDAKLLITTLYPRAMPLIRYDIGDAIRNYTTANNGVISFDAVLGRDNDLINVGEDAFVHPVALIHSIQAQNGVLGVQVIQEKDGAVSIDILAEAPLPEEAEAVIRRNLGTLHPSLNQALIRYVDHLEQTLAGKTKWIVRR
jgi:phenylacetate-CoA ligase